MPNTNTLLKNETSENLTTNLVEIAPEVKTEADTAEVVSIKAASQKTFKSFNLPDALQGALDKINFTTPTPIQQKAIPVALKGKDILGSAQTGTGKTAAFAIPAITKLINNPESTALILTPTRELATQIMTTIRPLLNGSHGIKTALLIGGEFIGKQMTQLRNRPRLIIGTPGRVNDHLARKSLNLSKTEILVLDETDRMLDLGFGIQIEHIVRQIPNNPDQPRQTLLFSATMPANIMQLSKRYLNNPEVIAIEPEKVTTANVKQEFIKISDSEKLDTLESIIEKSQGSVIVFVKTKVNSEKLAKKIAKFGADVIHGDLRQSRRDRVIKNFRQKEFKVLVATDVAARGLDIPHIDTVVNYDLPQCPEDYVHRIGRTGRNGASGEAFSFVSPSERRLMFEIEKLLNPGAKPTRDAGFDEGSRAGDRNRRGGSRGRNTGRGSNRSFNDGPFGGFKSRDGERNGSRDSGGFRNGGRDNGRDFNRGEGRNDTRNENRGDRSERNFRDNNSSFRDGGRDSGFKDGGFKNKGFRDNNGSRDNGFKESNRRGGFDNSQQFNFSDEESFGNRIDDFSDRKNNNSRKPSNGGFKGGFGGGARKTGGSFGGGFGGGSRSGGGYSGNRDDAKRNSFGTERPRSNNGGANNSNGGGSRKPNGFGGGSRKPRAQY